MENVMQVNDSKLVAELGYQAQVGKLFAFFDEPLFAEGAPLGWVSSFGTGAAGPRVVSLLDVAGRSLPGAKHAPLPLHLDLAVLVTDRELYREGMDTVHVTALDPLNPSFSKHLIVELDGALFRKIPIRLNLHGMATVPLANLPTGCYTVRFEESESQSISFTVAEYRLASLIATLEEKSFEQGELRFTLALNSFGHPVEGKVMIELISQGRGLEQGTLKCEAGRVRGSFPLSDQGPYSLNVQVVSEPSKTATVAISGSRSQERLATVFGRLGAEIEGSLLRRNSTERSVRGVYLRPDSTNNAPFSLEKIDSTKACVKARSDARMLTIVVADPAVARRPGANASSDIASCEFYKSGRRRYHEGHYAAALVELEKGREAQEFPHCNYAYHIARCYARLDRASEALSWLRRAVSDGWNDWSQMREDADLASLRADPGFELICGGGRRELVFPTVRAGQEIEIEVPLPLGFLALGAYVNGKPYEGWSFLLPPSELKAELKVAEKAEPGENLEIEIESSKPAGVYLLVKDQRLQSSDTPLNRLAAGLKKCAEEAGKQFSSGGPMTPFQDLGMPTQPEFWLQTGLLPEPPSARPEPVRRRRPGLIPRPGAPVQADTVESHRALLTQEAFAGPSPLRSRALEGFSNPSNDYDLMESLDFCEDIFGAPAGAGAAEPASTKQTHGPTVPTPTTHEDPEVLYSGVLETRDGRVVVRIDIPDNFGQYHIEATVMSGGDWSYQSRTCQVLADPYVSIEVPPFVHPRDQVRGRLSVSPNCSAELYLDDKLQQLDADYGFLVETGLYRAVVTSPDGQTRTQTRRVDEPGRLTRIVQSVRLLTAGESVSLKEDASVLSLQILPGLQKPFKMLLEETAAYGHLCCEQTAAKMVSGALMVLSGDKAGEAVFIAGWRRMESMALPSGGLSMYPGGALDTWWSPRAVVYLLGLVGLEGHKDFSPAMDAALRSTLELARRGQRVYNISWPAPRIEDCQAAYWSLRQSQDPAALPFVNRFLEDELGRLKGRVETRAQACYAAATLLLSRTQIPKALELTNQVLDQIEGGRLYSTYDSVAAIVLMNELRRAGIGAGGIGKVEVNGHTLSTEEAMKLKSIGSLRCLEKVCAVSLTRVVEECWESFDATVPLRLSLRKDGQVSNSFRAGDSLELHVRLEEGYQTGDLVWVCLPDSLSRLLGGGQVKRFSVDFEGRNEITIPLVATGVTGEQGQHFAVCVRNMFEEERVGSPGLLQVKVH